jgi:predicted CXXCH cytochrome family protein
MCHNPHGAYEHQLRAPLSQPTREQLCVTCHSRSGTPPWSVASPPTATSRGAHGAQGLLVLGEGVGWLPPGFAYDTTQMASSHGTAANPKLCATCHVSARLSRTSHRAFTFQSVGHTLSHSMPASRHSSPARTPSRPIRCDFRACSRELPSEGRGREARVPDAQAS